MEKRSYSLLLAAIAAGGANAAGATWTGATDGSWANADNWSPAAPAAGDTAVFDASSTANTLIQLSAATTVAGITVNGAPSPVSIEGDFTLTAGAVNVAGGDTLTFANGNAALALSSLTGAGTLEIRKAGTVNLAAAGTLVTPGSLAFNGRLVLRGGTATTAPGALAGSWTAIGGTSFPQAPGTSFALDTGAASDDARDVILTDVVDDHELVVSELTGFGTIRCDWSVAPGPSLGLRTLHVDQDTDTVFNGMILSHHGGTDRIRNLQVIKSGQGTLTLAGLVGRQTQLTGGSADEVRLDVREGTLVLGANNTRQGSISIATGATLQVGDGGETGTAGSGDILNEGTLAIDRAGTVTLNNGVSGSGALVKRGSGAASFTGELTHSGPTSVEEGLLQLNGFIDSPVTVTDGGSLGTGTPTDLGSTVLPSLTLEAGANLFIRAGDGISDLIEVDGADGLSAAGPVTITARPTGEILTGETFPVIRYQGTLGGGAGNFGIAPGTRFQLIHDDASKTFSLQFTGGTLTWTGSGGATWDMGTTQSWKLGNENTGFFLGDSALFDDSASVFDITLDGTLTPGSVTFENDTNDYQLGGGEIGGTTGLVKRGSAEVTIASQSSYTGTTVVEAGTLTFGDGESSGQIGRGPVEVLEGATLRIHRNDLLDYKADPRMRTVSGAGDIVIDGGGTFFNYTGSGVGFADPNSWAEFSGNLIIKGGSVFQTIRNGATAMGTGTVVLGDETSGGFLSPIEGNWTWTNPIELVGEDNAIINQASGVDRLLKLQGVISGDGGLAFEDATGAMANPQRGFILTGENTMSGTVLIGNGVSVRVGGVPGNADANQRGPGAGGTLGTATVENNGTLTFSRDDEHTVEATLQGGGTVVIGLESGGEDQIANFGNQSYSGDTIVRRGTLRVNGTLSDSFVTVESAGILGGIGTIHQDAVVSGAIAPGAAVGTLTSTADVALESGSRLIWEVSDWNGGAGTGHDVLNTSTLTVNADSATPVTVVITPASLTGFTEESKVFTLATTSAGITGFDAGDVVVDASAFPGNGTWEVRQTGNSLELAYTEGVADPFASWAFAKGLIGDDASPDADPDGDGIPNLVEFVLGTEPNPANPGSNSVDSLPAMTAIGAESVTFTFRRNAEAAFLSPAAEFSTELGTWTIADDDNATITVTPDGFEPGIDRVDVTIPRGSETKLFVRLRVESAPAGSL